MYRHILFLCFLLFPLCSGAQNKAVRFDNMDINDGLSQSLVNDLIQDRQGFIWIATQDGLNKYDGTRIVIYKKDPSDINSLSNNFIQSLYEDRDGFLWLGTNGGGLNRFDPRTGIFKRYDLGSQNRIVTDIAEDKDGNLWFSTTGNGVNKLVKEKERVLTYVFKGIEARNVQCVFVDAKGRIFAGSSGQGLLIYNKEHDRFDRINDPALHDVIWCINQDKQGIIWVGTNGGLVSMTESGESFVCRRYQHDPVSQNSLSNNSVSSIYITNEQLMIVGTTGNGIDIMDLNRPGFFINHHHDDSDNSSLADNLVQCVYEDRSGSIWIGTNEGLSRFDPLKQVFVQINHVPDNPNSLNDRTVWSIWEDKQGMLWVGTRKGLNRVDRRNNRVIRYERKANNPNAIGNNSVMTVYVDAQSRVWVGAIDGLFRLETTADYSKGLFFPVSFRPPGNGFADNRVYSIVEDSRRRIMWVGTKEGLSRIDLSNGSFRFFQNNPNQEGSLPSNTVRFIYVDHNGRTWVSTDGDGLSQIEDKEDKIRFRNLKLKLLPRGDEDDLLITSIWEDDHGMFWLGTYGSGLLQFDPDNEKLIRTYTEKDGLSNNSVYAVLGDDKGLLWMSTNYGLSCLDPKTGKIRRYLEKDGLQSNEFNTGAFHKNQRGELFFGGIQGLNYFHPTDLKDNVVAPEVVITDVLLFNKPLRSYDNLRVTSAASYLSELNLSYRENSLTISFAALHYSNPSSNRFRFIMEGLDDEYIEAGTTSVANYNKIPYGAYTFKVYACNSDGVWSEQPALLKITITPPFWATWWFRTILLVLLVGGVFAFNRARLISVKKQRLQLAREVRDRTWEVMEQKEKIEQQKQLLEDEKNKVEKLLLNILPEETAEELKSRGKASARSYRQVTVLFTDFVGFTKIAERMNPTDLVAKLDAYFIQFDEIIQKYNLEKIKTIGDSYMAAGGVPIRSKSNPIDTVLAALDIQRYMMELQEKAKETGDESWELRIGINTGEVIAGVIGTKRFAYDIWGNTVNTANRMQITCDPMMVNVSGTTFEQIEPYFECTYRGKIAAKNKGEIDMYYVHRIKPELSVDGLGIEPNETFWKYVDLYLYSSINYGKAERHIMRVLKEKLPSHLYYHGIHHTYDVVQAAERLALMEGITDEQMFILKSAATYHDAGFVEQYAKNEPIGIRMAQEILPKYGYTEEQVEEVANLIRATIIPHNPQSHLEEIICDADLDYLGRDDFHEIADTLRRELREQGVINSDRGWDEMQVKFLNMHKYFTKSAVKMRQEKKEKHIQDIIQKLATYNYKD
jgi:ligand-binding sensor domain-containing protein/class 3 adenylate cyclase